MLPDEALSEAAKTLSGTVWGSLVILGAATLLFLLRMWRADVDKIQTKADAAIKDGREELRLEREAHQRTRETQLTDLRNLARVAEALDEMRASDVKNQLLIADALQQNKAALENLLRDRELSYHAANRRSK